MVVWDLRPQDYFKIVLGCRVGHMSLLPVLMQSTSYDLEGFCFNLFLDGLSSVFYSRNIQKGENCLL